MAYSEEADKVEDLEFKWGKKRGIGGEKKEVQFYESFTYDGVDYNLHDCVYMYKEGEPKLYIGRLIRIWETNRKSKKVKVHWFFHPSEISNWLGDEQALENEIFLASGEGIGLANVNSLEAIAGKCNVICISKDVRNPQPSVEELQKAEYVFYRTFDVGKYTISDKMDDKVGGLEVKVIFNRKDGEKGISVSKHGSNRKENKNNDVACSSKLLPSGQNLPAEFKTVKTDGKQENLPGGIPGSGVDSIEVPTSGGKQSIFTGNKATWGKVYSVKDKVKASKVPVNQGGIEGRVEFSTDTNASNGRPSEKARIDSSVKLSEDNNMNGDQKLYLPGNVVKALVADASSSGENPKNGHVKNSFVPENKLKSAKDSGASEYRASKKMRFDNSVELLQDKSGNIGRKLNVNTDGSEAMNLVTSITSVGEKSMSRLSKDSLGLDQGPLKKEKPGEVSSGAAIDEDKKIEGQWFKVTRKPDVDNNKWFRTLPWEQRMQSAHESGTLVLLQNLNPEHTSGDVEDIIWHAFKEHCSAKMVQRTAISSSHSGQAFVIFKTRDAAGRVVRKLEDGCLMLSDKRKRLCLLHIVLSLTQLNMKWPWNGAYYTQDLTVGGRSCTSNKRWSSENSRLISSPNENPLHCTSCLFWREPISPETIQKKRTFCVNSFCDKLLGEFSCAMYTLMEYRE